MTAEMKDERVPKIERDMTDRSQAGRSIYYRIYSRVYRVHIDCVDYIYLNEQRLQ